MLKSTVLSTLAICAILLVTLSLLYLHSHKVAVEIGEKVAKAESLGAEGDVDESMALLNGKGQGFI